MTRAEWLARRKMLVGGSDIAKIAGLSPYGGPLDVYLDKLGLIPEQPDNWNMARGRALEPEILRVYSEREGVELETLPPFTLFTDGICGGTPDGLVVGGERGVEAKAPLYATGYGEPGTDEVPEPHLVQCTWYMGLTKRQRWDLAATIGANIEIFPLRFSSELYEALREMAEKFWRDHIIPQRPPAVDGSESSRAWLRQQFPENRKPLLEPTPEALELISLYPAIKQRLDAAEGDMETLKSQLMQMIGDAEGIKGVATWKKAKDTRATDWKAAGAHMIELLGADGQAIADAHTTTKAGSRRFLFSNSNGRK
jgi:putative phage-type endonuclease